MRTAFTVSMAIALPLAALMVVIGPFVASFYAAPALPLFMAISGATLIAGAFFGLVAALLQRDMEFGTLALIEVVCVILGAVTAIALAWKGYGAVSFAWSGLVQSVVAGIMPVCYRPAFWVFRPCFKDWKAVITFGGFTTISFALGRAYELFTYSVYGRLLSLDALGLYNRATMICDLPMKGVLSGIVPIALPALAAELRAGRCLKAAFFNGVALVTVVLWPALAIIALFAQPVVSILLGSQWGGVQSFVPIFAVAAAFSFSSYLTYPILVLAGDVKQTVSISLIALPPCAIIVVLAAHMGLDAVVWSVLITTPLQNAVALLFIRRSVFSDGSSYSPRCERAQK